MIEKPLTDDRSYRVVRLPNHLHVLLIHDPTTDKSAAALDVNVGSFADKKYGVSGLAHFCEHLLFMGTAKYPKENEYSSYLAKHSGSSNAYTSSEHTNYYFQVQADHLRGALDRFAQFFVAPLFSKSCQEREINAVDSENKKNLQQDHWRMHQLDRTNANVSHPYHGFSTGNYQTLHEDPINEGKDVREILMEFYRSHYSANIMNLVILGKEDLDTLQQWATEDFSAVPNKNLPREHYDNQPIYSEADLRTLTRARPIKESHKLEMDFLIPSDLDEHWSSRPASYYSHLLGHESEGSILHYVKHKGWVNELACGSMRVCKGNTLFVLDFDLTEEGLAHWEEIVTVVFQYLLLIRPLSWIWKEVSSISQLNFKFRQKSDASSTVSTLSNTMHRVVASNGAIPSEYILSHTLNRTYDPKAIENVGSYLSPENLRVVLVSQKLDNLDRKEQWYGTEYSYERLPPSLLSSLRPVQPNPSLHLPAPNEFIPTNFDVLGAKAENPALHPYIIHESSSCRVWYKQDDRFEVPKGSIDMLLKLPRCNASARSAALTHLYLELLEDDLVNLTYYASVVGLKVRFSSTKDGFHLAVSGYNDKLPRLLKEVLERLNFVPSRSRFDVLRNKVLQQYRNFGYNVPYQQIGTHYLHLVNEKAYTYKAKLAELETINYEEMESFAGTIWEEQFSEVLVHGNFDYQTAMEVQKLVKEKKASVRSGLRNYVLPPNAHVRYVLPLEDPSNNNSCIDYLIQISPHADDRLRVLTDLFATMVREPCFNQLRTKEQLGYVVFSLVKVGRTSINMRFIVQSERSSPYLEYRIDEFLANFSKHVNTLSDAEFADYKAALRAAKLTKLKSLSEEAGRFISAISDGYYDFEARQKHVGLLEEISRQEFIDFFNGYIVGPKSARLVVHLQSQAVPQQPQHKLAHAALINYFFRNGIEYEDLDCIKAWAGKNVDCGLLAKEVHSLVGVDEKVLERVIAEGIERPVPEDYPRGREYGLEEFRGVFELGDVPVSKRDLGGLWYKKPSKI